MWQKYKDWFFALLLISVTTVFTLWYLYLKPQHILSFLIGPIIALGFVAIMALFPKYRQRLIKKILAFHVKTQRRGGLLYRYGRNFSVVSFVILLAFSLVVTSNPEILAISYIPYLIVALAITFLISFAVYISGFLRAAGKWGLLFITIATAIAVLRILVLRNL